MPGVAIAISLVPPLGVVGVCLGMGEVGLALGALLLFLSNVVALVLAGTVVFTAYGYATDAVPQGLRKRRAYSVVTLVLLLVLVPLLVNTAANILITTFEQRALTAAQAWAATIPGARITDVTIASNTLVVRLESPTYPADPTALAASLKGQVPGGLRVVVETGLGQQVDGGVVVSP